MGQRVTLETAARLTGRAEKTLRAWLAEDPLPLTVTYGHWRGGVKVRGHVKKGRTRLLDVDELEALNTERGGTWHPEHMPPPDVDALAAEIAALKQRLETLERREPSRPSVLDTPRYTPPPSPTPALDASSGGVWTDAPAARARYTPHTRPLPQSSHMRGMRTHRLYTAFWRSDVQQASKGLMAYQTFGRLCGIRDKLIDTHRRREAAGELPHLTFTRVTYGQSDLRYVNAAQRAAWATYWRHLGHLTTAPDEESINRDLTELASWERDTSTN